jgi:hypothetical protein
MDKGADITMIPIHILPKEIKIQPSNQRAIVANGLPIKVIGMVKKLYIEIKSIKAKILEALVMDTKVNHILFGST